MSMKCPNCNREIDNDSIFCEWCGSKIQDVINLKAKEEMVTLFLEKSAKLFPKSKISVIQERLLNVSSEQLEKILSCDYEEVFTESYKTRIVLGFILQVITISILIVLYYTSIFYWHSSNFVDIIVTCAIIGVSCLCYMLFPSPKKKVYTLFENNCSKYIK